MEIRQKLIKTLLSRPYKRYHKYTEEQLNRLQETRLTDLCDGVSILIRK